MKKITILKYHLYCLKVVGLCATAQVISDKFNQFIEERGLDWKKCKSVTTDGAAAMQGSTNGVVRNIKIISLDCVSTHCMVHWEIDGRKQSAVRSGDCCWCCHRNSEFNLLTFKETLNVFRTAQTHGSRGNEVTIPCWGTMIIQRKSFKTGVSTASTVAVFSCWRRTHNVHKFSRQLLPWKIVLLFSNISEHKSFEFIVARVGVCVTFLKLPVKFRRLNKNWSCGKVKDQ